VGRRIAERLVRSIAAGESPKAELSPDVVEAACLAHDLGHPPFGHIAEKLLDRLAVEHGLSEGFEGNAQSFRIVTSLAVGSAGEGLNLTCATLNAILKYPWFRGDNTDKPDKWGAYRTEELLFNFARELGPKAKTKTLEASIMDWADDITYSVHDVDDFFRAGVIPLDRLAVDAGERERFYSEVFARIASHLPSDMDQNYLRGVFDALGTKLPLQSAYNATREARKRLRSITSTLIADFVRGTNLSVEGNIPSLAVDKTRRAEAVMLKELTWHYVIKNPALATHQEGQRQIIRGLFDKFFAAATSKTQKNLELFPTSVRELLPEAPELDAHRADVVRVIVDFVSSLTEEQATHLFHRLYGVSLGPALTQSVR
jgi:dGTPase